MGIDRRLVDMWKSRRSDMLTMMSILKELRYATEEGTACAIETLDSAVAAREASKVSK